MERAPSAQVTGALQDGNETTVIRIVIEEAIQGATAHHPLGLSTQVTGTQQDETTVTRIVIEEEIQGATLHHPLGRSIQVTGPQQDGSDVAVTRTVTEEAIQGATPHHPLGDPPPSPPSHNVIASGINPKLIIGPKMIGAVAGERLTGPKYSATTRGHPPMVI